MYQQQEAEKSIFQELGITKKKILFVILALLALVTYDNSCSVVKQRERGVEYVFGKVSGGVIKPGLKFHAPFVSRIQKYSIAPKTFEATFPVGNAGAITRDMQTVGTTVNVKYAYDEARIMDIATRYGDSVIESAMKSNIIASVKEAEAKKQAVQLEAEAALIKAQNEAKAKQAEADGIAYYNAKVAQNMVVQERQWKHEEQMAYYEKWDGVLVPDYIPLTAAGGIVNLK